MPRNIFVLGDFNRICDRCGFKYKASETRKEWTGLIVCNNCWEPRNAQEFLRGIPDKQAAPEPRPDAVPNFSLAPIAYPTNYLVFLSSAGYGAITANHALIMYIPPAVPLSSVIGD